MTLSKYSPVRTWRLFPNTFLVCLTLGYPVILPNTKNELLKNKQNACLLFDTQSSLHWKVFHLFLEEVIQKSVTKTFAHLQHPSCYRHSCEMQLNLATPQACRPGLRNSRRCFLMGCEVLLFCILLEVLGIMTRVFPDMFGFHYI